MEEWMAADAAQEPDAAGGAAGDPAGSQEGTQFAAGQRESGGEDGGADAADGTGVTQPRAFARGEGFDDPDAFTENTRAERARDGLAGDEKTLLEKERDTAYREMREQGAPHEAALDFANRRMNERGALMLSRARSETQSLAEREKLEQTVGELTRKVEELTAERDAREEGRASAQASTGPAAGEPAADRDFYTSEEYDRLPQARKDELFESGRIFQMMARWAK